MKNMHFLIIPQSYIQQIVSSLMNYKDGHSILADPEVMQFIFKKINNKWKVIYGVDSYVEKTVKQRKFERT